MSHYVQSRDYYFNRLRNKDWQQTGLVSAIILSIPLAIILWLDKIIIENNYQVC